MSKWVAEALTAQPLIAVERARDIAGGDIASEQAEKPAVELERADG
jgi:hypothetical protein